MKRNLILLCMLICSVNMQGCGPTKLHWISASSFSMDSTEYVVPKDIAEQFVVNPLRGKYRNLSKRQMMSIRRIVMDCLDERKEELALSVGNSPYDYAEYVKQMYAYRYQGELIAVVNLRHFTILADEYDKESPGELKKRLYKEIEQSASTHELVDVADGGVGVGTVIINLKKKEVISITFHGEA